MLMTVMLVLGLGLESGPWPTESSVVIWLLGRRQKPSSLADRPS